MQQGKLQKKPREMRELTMQEQKQVVGGKYWKWSKKLQKWVLVDE